MNLSLMKTVFSTVDDEWNSIIASKIASRWIPEPDAVKIMRASANFSALVENEGSYYTLRFNSEHLRPIEVLQREIRLLLALRNFNLPVQVPVKSIDNNYAELITTKNTRFTGVMFEYIKGEIKEISQISLDEFQRWGSALGKLHAALAKNQLTQSINHPIIQDQLKSAQPPTEKGSAEKGALLEWITTLDADPGNYGIIHYDFELDNLIWTGDQIRIIDFDDTAISWFAADIAFALRDLWKDIKGVKDDPRYQAFFAGYLQENVIEDINLDLLGKFYRLHNFLTYHRLVKAVDLEPSSKNPQWLNNLIVKLTALLNDYHRSFTGEPL